MQQLLSLPQGRTNFGCRSCSSTADCLGCDYAWSPDEQQLAIADGPLYVVSSDGSNPRQLVGSGACRPAWSPDSLSLVYFTDTVPCDDAVRGGASYSDSGYRSLYRTDVDGSHRRLLARGSFGAAAWSPDGRTLAVRNHCQVRFGDDWWCAVGLMNADGTGKHPLTKLAASPESAFVAWIAAGRDVLSRANLTLLVTDAATGKTHSLEIDGTPAGISDNGTRIAIDRPSPGTARVFGVAVISAEGRTLSRTAIPRGWQVAQTSVHLP
jgi:hypothetical protein